MFGLEEKNRKFITALCFSVTIAGCESTDLEFDRMTSTAFPTGQTLSGEDWTLQSIYSEAGKLLVVNEDHTNIAALGNECITNAELDALETANRDSAYDSSSWACSFWIFSGTCKKFYAYGIVTDHYATYSSGACKRTVLGRMWDTTDRGAFAIFYKHSTINTDGEKYLRTTAHELGHAFNLHHDDGTGSSTIMNQTSVVGDTFSYDFSNNSETHLKDHKDECVYPGTNAWGIANTAHAAWAGNHGVESANCN